jgi:hypothetical protein
MAEEVDMAVERQKQGSVLIHSVVKAARAGLGLETGMEACLQAINGPLHQVSSSLTVTRHLADLFKRGQSSGLWLNE